MSDAPTDPFEAYTFSTDYAQLWELVQTKAVICLADCRVGEYLSLRSLVWWEYNTLYKKVRLSRYALHPNCKELSLPLFWTNSVEDFTTECTKRNLQWLVPPTKVGSLHITKYLDLDCYTNTEFQQSVDLAPGNYTLFTLT
jgi:hypothetical protein